MVERRQSSITSEENPYRVEYCVEVIWTVNPFLYNSWQRPPLHIDMIRDTLAKN